MRGVVIFLLCVAAAGRGDGSDEWKEHTRCNSPTLSRMLQVTNLNPSVAGCVCMPSVYVCMLDFFVFGGKFNLQKRRTRWAVYEGENDFKSFLFSVKVSINCFLNFIYLIILFSI